MAAPESWGEAGSRGPGTGLATRPHGHCLWDVVAWKMPTVHMGNREIVLRSPRSLLLGLVFPSSLGGQDIRGRRAGKGSWPPLGFVNTWSKEQMACRWHIRLREATQPWPRWRSRLFSFNSDYITAHLIFIEKLSWDLSNLTCHKYLRYRNSPAAALGPRGPVHRRSLRISGLISWQLLPHVIPAKPKIISRASLLISFMRSWMFAKYLLGYWSCLKFVKQRAKCKLWQSNHKTQAAQKMHSLFNTSLHNLAKRQHPFPLFPPV